MSKHWSIMPPTYESQSIGPGSQPQLNVRPPSPPVESKRVLSRAAEAASKDTRITQGKVASEGADRVPKKALEAYQPDDASQAIDDAAPRIDEYATHFVEGAVGGVVGALGGLLHPTRLDAAQEEVGKAAQRIAKSSPADLTPAIIERLGDRGVAEMVAAIHDEFGRGHDTLDKLPIDTMQAMITELAGKSLQITTKKELEASAEILQSIARTEPQAFADMLNRVSPRSRDDVAMAFAESLYGVELQGLPANVREIIAGQLEDSQLTDVAVRKAKVRKVLLDAAPKTGAPPTAPAAPAKPKPWQMDG